MVRPGGFLMTPRNVRFHWWMIGLIVPFVATERAVGVVSLQATSATVATAGETADLCVVLNSGGAEVAGTQNDLVWDDSCATLKSFTDCSANPATGKSLHGSLLGGFFRALVLSLSDTNPIPDGQLYCCTFTAEATPGNCCSVSVVNTGASDPSGQVVLSVGNTAELCVEDSGGTVAPTPTPTVHTALPSSDNDGCQISPESTHGLRSATAILLALLLLAWMRRQMQKGRE